MKHFVIRYRALPERAEENQRLIEAVFAQLKAAAPPGIRYRVMRGADDTFFHLVSEDEGGSAGLTSLEAFKAFSSTVRERCAEPPVRTDLVVVGDNGQASV